MNQRLQDLSKQSIIDAIDWQMIQDALAYLTPGEMMQLSRAFRNDWKTPLLYAREGETSRKELQE